MVKKAISDAGGILSRAAALLGCSRPTLYTWIYQLGLERIAGIRIDTRDRLDRQGRKDTRVGETIKSGVKSAAPGVPILRVVTTQAPPEIPVAATVKLPEGLWRNTKIAAIRRRVNVSEFVKLALEAMLADEAAAAPRRARNGKREDER